MQQMKQQTGFDAFRTQFTSVTAQQITDLQNMATSGTPDYTKLIPIPNGFFSSIWNRGVNTTYGIQAQPTQNPVDSPTGTAFTAFTTVDVQYAAYYQYINTLFSTLDTIDSAPLMSDKI